MFETVYTCTDWWDGPRGGIADLLGSPYLFKSEWDDANDDYANTFLLCPVDAETFALALEQWAIWRRWETAYYRGQTTIAEHPALLEERPRYDELTRLLTERLVIDKEKAVRKAATFQKGREPNWSGLGQLPLQVKWEDVAAAP